MLTAQARSIALADPVPTAPPRPGRTRVLLYGASLIGGIVLWQLLAIAVLAADLAAATRRVAAVLRDARRPASCRPRFGARSACCCSGYGLAIVVGFPVGFRARPVRALSVASEPVINAIYAVPPVALVPFLIIWFGLLLQSQIALVFLMAVFEIVITMRAGVRTVEPRLLDAARSFGCGGVRRAAQGRDARHPALCHDRAAHRLRAGAERHDHGAAACWPRPFLVR